MSKDNECDLNPYSTQKDGVRLFCCREKLLIELDLKLSSEWTVDLPWMPVIISTLVFWFQYPVFTAISVPFYTPSDDISGFNLK